MDPQLIEKAKKGSHEAFREIFEHLSGRVFAYAVSRASTREDAMDIAQETFIDLWRALKNFKFRSDEEFSGFVFKIVKRKLFAYYQKRSLVLEPENFNDLSYEMETPDYRFLLKNLNTLASNYQEMLKLRYWSGMTFAEIASFLDINEGTAKVWHHRAVKQLQALLNKYENAI